MFKIIKDIMTYFRINIGERFETISIYSDEVLTDVQLHVKKWFMRFAIIMFAFMGGLILFGLAHNSQFVRDIMSSTDYMNIIIVFTITVILSKFGIAVYERFEKHFLPLDFLICTMALVALEFVIGLFTGLSMIARVVTILGVTVICLLVCKKEWWVKRVRYKTTSFVDKCKNAAFAAPALSMLLWLILREIEWRGINIIAVSAVMFIITVMLEIAEEYTRETKEGRRWE